MRTLRDSLDLIAQSDVLEIGCGADRGLISEIQKRGGHCLGIDLEPGANNQDSIFTELELKFRKGGLSCYPYYPDNITNVWQAAQFLRAQLNEGTIDASVKYWLDEIEKVQAQAEDMAFHPSFRIDEALHAKVIEGDARTMLSDLNGKSFGTIYAESFLHNFDSATMNNWSALIKARLRHGGKLVVIQRMRDKIGAMIEGVTSSGLVQVESAPLDLASDGICSQRTKTLMEAGLSEPFYRLVYQNV